MGKKLEELVVTPAQKVLGYRIFADGAIFHADYEVIRELPDGNWLVKYPQAIIKGLNLRSSVENKEE